MAVGAAVTVVGSLLPWLRTGARRRNSYDALAVVERIGFSPEGAAAQGLRWWPIVPMLAATGVVVAWWGWRRPGGAVGALAGSYAGIIGVAVATADAGEFVAIGPGPAVTALGGATLLAGSIATVVISPPDRRRPTHRAR
jgi:hypothetical protein